MENEEMLIESIQSAIADYAYETGESDFSAVIAVSVVDGWVKAEIKECVID